MKKQLLALSVLALCCTPRCYTAGVFVMAQMNKITEKMTAGTKQKINASDARIVSSNPTTTEESVIELSETKPGKWVLSALNPGTAVIELKKDKSGHKVKKHHCKHTITVMPSKTIKTMVKEKTAKATRTVKRKAQEASDAAKRKVKEVKKEMRAELQELEKDLEDDNS